MEQRSSKEKQIKYEKINTLTQKMVFIILTLRHVTQRDNREN